MFQGIQDAWSGMLNDPQKREQFQQFALALMQSRPDITPFGNIGTALQQSQNYIMAQREMGRKRLAEERGEARENRALEAEINKNTEMLSLKKRELADNRLNRTAENWRAAQRVKGGIEEAKVRAESDKYTTDKNVEDDKNKTFARTELVDRFKKALLRKNPLMNEADAEIRAILMTQPQPAGLYQPQFTENDIVNPSASDVLEGQIAAASKSTPTSRTDLIGKKANVKGKDGKVVEMRIVAVTGSTVVLQDPSNPTKQVSVPLSSMKE